MTREKKPDFCDLCGNEIQSEQVFKLKIEEKFPYGSPNIVEGDAMDMCHPCLLGICKKAVGTPHQYKPNWKYYTRNPAWYKGAPKTIPYKIERKMEPDTKQEVIAAV